MRRSGKSTILQLLARHLSASGVPADRVVLINMESLENAHPADVAALHRFVRNRRENAGSRLHLFIDELQEIPGWEKAVNSFLADDEADIFITGSNSRLLSGERATLLAGRYVEFSVFPLVFSEFAVFRNRPIEPRHRRPLQRLRGGFRGRKAGEPALCPGGVPAL